MYVYYSFSYCPLIPFSTCIAFKIYYSFANKQDYDNAVDEIGVCNLLDIETILGERKECCRVVSCTFNAYTLKTYDTQEPCTALYSANNGKKDPAIRRGAV